MVKELTRKRRKNQKQKKNSEPDFLNRGPPGSVNQFTRFIRSRSTRSCCSRRSRARELRQNFAKLTATKNAGSIKSNAYRFIWQKHEAQ